MSSEFSTNVRSVSPPPLAVSPALAASAVAPFFFLAPRRRPRSWEEREVLKDGVRLEIVGERRRMPAWRWGTGPAVLLVHGWGGCAGQMTPFVWPLLRAGFSAVAIDAPAHGEAKGRLASIPVFAAAIERAAEVAGPLAGVVAHSMGSAAFSLAASRGLLARRAVFVGPPSDAAVWYRDFVRWLSLPEAAEPAFRARIEAIAGERLDRLNVRALGPEMKVPLLVIHDRHDREVPLSAGQEVARFSADARLLVTERLGHRRILKDPDVADAAVRFLVDGRVGAPAPGSAWLGDPERAQA